MVVASPDDLVGAVARDRRMVGYRLRRQGEGWIELDVTTDDDVRTALPWLRRAYTALDARHGPGRA